MTSAEPSVPHRCLRASGWNWPVLRFAAAARFQFSFSSIWIAGRGFPAESYVFYLVLFVGGENIGDSIVDNFARSHLLVEFVFQVAEELGGEELADDGVWFSGGVGVRERTQLADVFFATHRLPTKHSLNAMIYMGSQKGSSSSLVYLLQNK